jgi:hypothetical protein
MKAQNGRKKCWRCGLTKGVDEFQANALNADGLQSECVPCRAEIKAHYEAGLGKENNYQRWSPYQLAVIERVDIDLKTMARLTGRSYRAVSIKRSRRGLV